MKKSKTIQGKEKKKEIESKEEKEQNNNLENNIQTREPVEKKRKRSNTINVNTERIHINQSPKRYKPKSICKSPPKRDYLSSSMPSLECIFDDEKVDLSVSLPTEIYNSHIKINQTEYSRPPINIDDLQKNHGSLKKKSFKLGSSPISKKRRQSILSHFSNVSDTDTTEKTDTDTLHIGDGTGTSLKEVLHLKEPSLIGENSGSGSSSGPQSRLTASSTKPISFIQDELERVFESLSIISTTNENTLVTYICNAEVKTESIEFEVKIVTLKSQKDTKGIKIKQLNGSEKVFNIIYEDIINNLRLN